MRAHTRGNMTAPAAIPGYSLQPWRIQDSGGSDPPGADSGGG
jgi:hypothetical protein